MNNRKFSQQESRMIASWLKEKHKLDIRNSFLFWRKSPSQAAEWIKAGWKNVTITAVDLEKAAGREVEEQQ